MKKTLLIACAALTSLGAAEGDALLSNSFSMTGDFVYFKREQEGNKKLMINSSTGNCVCSSKHLVHDFPFEPGYRVGVSYTTDHSVWDLSYLWIKEWESSCSRTEPGTLVFSLANPDITNDFDGADHAKATYGSEFQNVELNYYRYAYERHGNFFSAAYLLGLRYMNLREHLDVAFTNGSDKSSYKVQTSNHIPAIQGGGLIAWNPTRTITWDLIGMVGIGFDIGEQKTFLGDLNNTVTVRDYEKRGFSTPVVVEGVIRLTYQPTTYFNIHAAYQLIYLNGVALAPDQIVKSDSNEHVYKAIGAPLMHGFSAGMTWSF